MKRPNTTYTNYTSLTSKKAFDYKRLNAFFIIACSNKETLGFEEYNSTQIKKRLIQFLQYLNPNSLSCRLNIMYMYINLHTHHPSLNKNTIEIVNADLNTPITNTSYYSAGIHPWKINENSYEELEQLEKLANDQRLIAIGECGLDKLMGPAIDKQIELFKAQIYFSEKLHLPLIIHCVKAYSEIIKLKKDFAPNQHWVFHGFNASKDTMEQALKYGFYFSMGKTIFSDKSKACRVLPDIPTDRLFFETDDDPQLSISSVYDKASSILKIDSAQLQSITYNNFKCIFNVD